MLDRAGNAVEALGWAREHGLSAADDLSYVREFEHITLAGCSWPRELAIAPTSRSATAIELLERLLAAAEAGGRTGSVIEILVVQALAHQAPRRRDRARSRRWRARSRWPSPRATSGSSSTRARRWRPC